MRRLTLVLAAAIGLAACGGGEPTGPGAAPLSITLPLDTIRPGGVLMVDVTGGQFSSDTVTGKVGETSVTFVRVNDSTVAMIAPDLPAGRHTVSIDLPGGTLRTSVDVKPALTFPDPKAALFQALDAQVAGFPANAPPGMDPAVWAARKAKLDSMVQEAKAEITSLDAAQQLELARVMVPIMAQPGGAVGASFLNWRDVSCRNAMRAVARSALGGVLMSVSLYVFIASPNHPLLKAAGIGTSGLALVAIMLQLNDDMAKFSAECVAQETVDVSDQWSSASLSTSGAPVRTPGASYQTSSAAPRRFFKGYGVRYFPIGGFRPVSRTEVALDAELAAVSRNIDRVHANVTRARNRLPSRIAARLPALPTRLSQPPGSLTTELQPPAELRIENVKPASVQLAMSASGQQIVLTPGASTTKDVPFTYDLVVVADPKVRKTIHGVLRPFMDAQHVVPGATITGDRTVVRRNGVDYGVLTCAGSWPLRVTGGDKARAESFDWEITGWNTESGSTPMLDSQGNPLIFEAGDLPLNGSWYWAANDGQGPVYHPFNITVRVQYTDLVTGELKSAISPTVRCI